MTKIKAVIFDMDGVLIDAKEWHYSALNRALSYFGIEISKYEHLVTYDGLPTKQKLQMLSIDRGLPVGLHQFINNLKQQFTSELVFANCKPQFQHQFALSNLKSNGYLIAVCSNSIKQTIEMMLQKADLLRHIDFYLSNQDVVNSKPNPEIYIKAISRFKLLPEECLIIEDNPNGIKAGIESGAHVFEVSTVNDVNYQNIISKINEIESHHG
ncbi:HAD family hydrolase [Chitinilyticum litopenaei]|uniref:HAD family hydrolase n=1 Tax=Chitinilyticum litopenaei TaxID=1121276 RepID=UPI0004906F24|nr:HAD family phosphatase [Chitinilyticum litopenaei]